MRYSPPSSAAWVGIIAAALASAACGVGPSYERPALPDGSGVGQQALAPASSGPPNSGQGALTLRLVNGQDVPAQWWRIFHNPQLDALVARALVDNPTMEAARATLRAAHEQVLAQRGAYYPSVAASVQPSRQRIATTLASPAASGSDYYNLTTTQLTVSYAPDLFGGNSRAVESLVAAQDQAGWEMAAARLTLAANVALAAIQDGALRTQVDRTQAIIAAQERIIASWRAQAVLGQASRADLAAQEAALAQARAALPPLQRAFRVNRDLIAALVGRTPAEDPGTAFDLDGFVSPQELPVSLPAALIEQRPDIRISEAALHAACAQVGVAEAARWPSFSIDGSLGSAALGLVPKFGSLVDFWSIAATLTTPIFEGGTLLHHERAARELYGAAKDAYRSTVIGAFQNTADALHALWTDGDALAAATDNDEAARRSLAILGQQLALGDANELAVLAAEQAERQADLALVQVRAGRLGDVVALYAALGGGWWPPDPAHETRER
jgi:NodT family efflux transporter outer membrane factor (OMF) lipoprotein